MFFCLWPKDEVRIAQFAVICGGYLRLKIVFVRAKYIAKYSDIELFALLSSRWFENPTCLTM